MLLKIKCRVLLLGQDIWFLWIAKFHFEITQYKKDLYHHWKPGKILLAVWNLKGYFSKEKMQNKLRKMEHKPNIFNWESKASPMG